MKSLFTGTTITAVLLAAGIAAALPGGALAAEQVHARLFKEALEAMKAGKDLSTMDVYLCPVCGDIEFGEPPEKCPICNAPRSKYQKV